MFTNNKYTHIGGANMLNSYICEERLKFGINEYFW